MSTKRSYKAEFLRWKAEVEKKHGKMIYDRLSEVIDTDDDLAVGDTVLFTNDYGVTFGPHEVLGFCRPDSFLCPHRYPEDEDCGIVFSDNDAYWFPDRPGPTDVGTERRCRRMKAMTDGAILARALRQCDRRPFRLAQILYSADLFRS